MLTDEGLSIEYEGDRWKAGFLNGRHMILVSGAMSAHADLVQKIHRIVAPRDDWTTLEIAEKWSELVIEYTRKDAARMYLAPLTLDERSFVRRSKLMEPTLAVEVANQMQGHRVDAEALIIGCESKTVAHLYYVDKRGRVTCHDHTGFVSIGSGGIHASAHFMLEEHSANSWYYPTLFSTFTAKKKAEVAPFVGSRYTDMFRLTYNGAHRVPDSTVTKMQEIYTAHATERRKMVERDMQAIFEFEMATTSQPPPDAKPAPEENSKTTELPAS